ncbi:MAG UNVERIFIED_CONTAM: hypothetical protein LVR18_41145 [Planctomycetaceae bacterium]
MGEQAQDPDERLQTLLLQQTAVEALLTHAGDNTDAWRPVLHLLLVNWLREASYSAEWDPSTSRGPRMQRDQFGNFFWQQDPVEQMRQMQMQNGMPRPIPSGKLLDARPNDRWLAFLNLASFPPMRPPPHSCTSKSRKKRSHFPGSNSSQKLTPRKLVGWSKHSFPHGPKTTIPTTNVVAPILTCSHSATTNVSMPSRSPAASRNAICWNLPSGSNGSVRSILTASTKSGWRLRSPKCTVLPKSTSSRIWKPSSAI